jgi:hypothetical protein
MSCEPFNDPNPNYIYAIPNLTESEGTMSSLEAEGMDEATPCVYINLLNLFFSEFT